MKNPKMRSLSANIRDASFFLAYFRQAMPLAICLGIIASPLTLQAQITPDSSLPNNSVITRNSSNLNITGGTTVGTNLFHSFAQFSIFTGQTAYFNHATNIQNILSRVTGGQISTIDGTIRANGRTNLFLINPNGIIFGQNAQLRLGGSFVGTTAHSLKLSDGSEFSAINPQAPSLLAINLPIGLQMGTPAAIVVQGNGSNLQFDSRNSAIIRDYRSVGLQVAPGQTLSLVGGDIALEGGNLTAEGGRIELWSVTNGLLGIINNNGKLAITKEQTRQFADIRLTSAASVDASGNSGGAIQVQGRRISLLDGAAILATTLGTGDGRGITVGASESVAALGFSQNWLFPSSISTTSAAGTSNKAGDIAIATPSLLVGNGGRLASTTLGAGNAGNMTVTASSVATFGTLNNLNASGLFTATTSGSTGNAGDLTIETQRLRLTDGAQILATTTGAGNGGNLTIRATEAVEVMGFAEFRNPALPTASIKVGSTIASSVTRRGVTGNAGNLTIETGRLTVQGGGQIVTATYGLGKGADLTVRATDSVELIGTSGTNPPAISSLSALAGSNSTGNAGNLTIETPQLTIRDGATATVTNLAQTGTAGDLKVNADSINLLGGGSLDAQTAAGDRGNITINSQNILLRNNSRITTNAQRTATGGNITINTSTLLGAENSDITANAQKGAGGRISITAEGIFGIEFRQQLTPQSDITATSDLGLQFSGTVQIDLKGTDIERAVVPLPETVVDSSQQITTGCSDHRANSFTITGRGGLPPAPREALNATPGWIDWRILAKSDAQSNREALPTQVVSQTSLVEATGWVVEPDGTVRLVANSTESSPLPLNCRS